MWNSGLLKDIANRASTLAHLLQGPAQIKSHPAVSEERGIRTYTTLIAQETATGSGAYRLFELQSQIMVGQVRHSTPLGEASFPLPGAPLTREQAVARIDTFNHKWGHGVPRPA